MGFFKEKHKVKEWIPPFVFVAAVIIFYKLIDWIPGLFSFIGNFIGILSPFFIALIIAVILYVPSSKIEALLKKKNDPMLSKCARGISVLLTYLVFIALIVLAFSFVIPRIIESIVNLIDAIPDYYNTITKLFEERMDANGKFYGIDVKGLLSFLTPERVLSFFNLSDVTSYIGKVVAFGSSIISVIIGFIVSVYMLLARERLTKSFRKFFSIFLPESALKKTGKFTVAAANIFNKYIYSQLLDACILGIFMSIALSIIGLDYAILFGMLIGICNLIPYFGATISCGVVIIFSMISQGFGKALIVAIVIIVIQQLDANILQPRIVGDSLGLHPFYVLLAITIGSGYFGFWGILIGVPIIAIIKLLVNYIYDMHDLQLKEDMQKQSK